MVGTRLIYTCLAVCILTADATQVSVAAAAPETLASIGHKRIGHRPAISAPVSALPVAAARFGAQSRTVHLQAAKSVPFGTDIGLKLLVAAMLVAYQLRRKHRALRAQPFSQ